MGVECLPGRTGRGDGGQSEGTSRDAAQYGRGTQDPLTGLFEWYEFPEGFIDQVAGGEGLSLLTLLEQWPLIECDFQSEYGIRLGATDLSWREFRTRMTGLFATDSRIRRHFTDKSEPDEGGQP